MNFQRSKNSYQEEDLRSSEARNSLFETLCCRDWPVLGWTIWLNYLWLCSTIKLQSKYKWIQVKSQSKTVTKSQFTITLFDVLFCFDYIGLPSSHFAGKTFEFSTEHKSVRRLGKKIERRKKTSDQSKLQPWLWPNSRAQRTSTDKDPSDNRPPQHYQLHRIIGFSSSGLFINSLIL